MGSNFLVPLNIMHWDHGHKAPMMGRAAKASVLVASILIVIKSIAWFMTGSIALLGSLVDSVLDLAASFVNFIAIRASLEPPDSDHRFGHGKAEAIAGVVQSSIIFGSSIFIFMESVSRLFNPQPIEATNVGIIVSVIAIVLTFALVLYQKHVVKQTGSVAIEADSLHYTGDLLLNAAVILALFLVNVEGFAIVDGIIGVGIAGYIAWTAVGIGRSSIDMLMDKEFEKAEREEIFNLVMGNPDVKGMHDLKTRRSGLQSFIQMHIELDPEMKLYDAHAVADEVEATVGEVFGNAEILIHTDPLGLEQPPLPHTELE
ncbi:MAG: cation diffusion facilitator family transporter [Sphingomonadales bacterium]|nr:cation diffusion facilitator family transporter [Sphingomonadales bacterium]